MNILSINNNRSKNVLKSQKKENKVLSFGFDFMRNSSSGDLYRAINFQTEKWNEDEPKKDSVLKTRGHHAKKSKCKIKKETLYNIHGRPSFVHEYRDGELYKITHFDMFSNKIGWIKYTDDSFGLYQHIDENKESVEMTKKYGDDVIQINFDAVLKNGATGGFNYSRKQGKDFKSACTIYWNYPSMTFNCRGLEVDKKEYIAALLVFQKTILSKEYKSNFGCHKNLNKQLNKVIKYLENNKNVFL